MRGGTSRALFFHDADLPADPELRDRVLSAAMGSPDPYGRQVDGMGGAISSTSKVAIIRPSDQEGVDVDYEFAQVDIRRPLVDRGGNCGNISSAVGPFAIDDGLVSASDPETTVRFVNTNTRKLIIAHVPTRDGRFDPEGTFEILGVPGTASRIVLDYMDPGGAVTGRLLPTGNALDILAVPGLGEIEVSIVDAANPLVFCRFDDVGMRGDEQPEEVDGDAMLRARLESVRAAAAVLTGLAPNAETATTTSPSIPKLALVAPRRPYRTIDGAAPAPSSFDIVGKMMSMGTLHRSYPLTGAICTTVAARLPGTIVATLMPPDADDSGLVRIGHPAGVFALNAMPRQVDGVWQVDRVSADRTARRLMEGFVYVPDRVLSARTVSVSPGAETVVTSA